MKIEWVNTAELTPRPNNRNSHPEEQIDRLAKIVDHNGFRVPIIVSKLSGLVVAGHGRLEAAKRLGLEKVPVIYQDFASEDEEYQFHVADNGIARWAELDLSGINADLENIGPIDIDLLGIKNFQIDFLPGSIDDQGQLDQKKLVIMECPHCGEKFEQGQAQIID